MMFDAGASSPPIYPVEAVVQPLIRPTLRQLDQAYRAGQITLATLLIEHLYRRLDHAAA